jgi:hypothetical protein
VSHRPDEDRVVARAADRAAGTAGCRQRIALQGRVTDSSNGVRQGASVTVMPVALRGTTSAEGEYLIVGLVLRGEKQSEDPDSVHVTVVSGR